MARESRGGRRSVCKFGVAGTIGDMANEEGRRRERVRERVTTNDPLFFFFRRLTQVTSVFRYEHKGHVECT